MEPLPPGAEDLSEPPVPGVDSHTVQTANDYANYYGNTGFYSTTDALGQSHANQYYYGEYGTGPYNHLGQFYTTNTQTGVDGSTKQQIPVQNQPNFDQLNQNQAHSSDLPPPPPPPDSHPSLSGQNPVGLQSNWGPNTVDINSVGSLKGSGNSAAPDSDFAELQQRVLQYLKRPGDSGSKSEGQKSEVKSEDKVKKVTAVQPLKGAKLIIPATIPKRPEKKLVQNLVQKSENGGLGDHKDPGQDLFGVGVRKPKEKSERLSLLAPEYLNPEKKSEMELEVAEAKEKILMHKKMAGALQREDAVASPVQKIPVVGTGAGNLNCEGMKTGSDWRRRSYRKAGASNVPSSESGDEGSKSDDGNRGREVEKSEKKFKREIVEGVRSVSRSRSPKDVRSRSQTRSRSGFRSRSRSRSRRRRVRPRSKLRPYLRSRSGSRSKRRGRKNRTRSESRSRSGSRLHNWKLGVRSMGQRSDSDLDRKRKRGKKKRRSKKRHDSSDQSQERSESLGQRSRKHSRGGNNKEREYSEGSPPMDVKISESDIGAGVEKRKGANKAELKDFFVEKVEREGDIFLKPDSDCLDIGGLVGGMAQIDRLSHCDKEFPFLGKRNVVEGKETEEQECEGGIRRDALPQDTQEENISQKSAREASEKELIVESSPAFHKPPLEIETKIETKGIEDRVKSDKEHSKRHKKRKKHKKKHKKSRKKKSVDIPSDDQPDSDDAGDVVGGGGLNMTPEQNSNWKNPIKKPAYFQHDDRVGKDVCASPRPIKRLRSDYISSGSPRHSEKWPNKSYMDFEDDYSVAVGRPVWHRGRGEVKYKRATELQGNWKESKYRSRSRSRSNSESRREEKTRGRGSRKSDSKSRSRSRIKPKSRSRSKSPTKSRSRSLSKIRDRSRSKSRTRSRLNTGERYHRRSSGQGRLFGRSSSERRYRKRSRSGSESRKRNGVGNGEGIAADVAKAAEAARLAALQGPNTGAPVQLSRHARRIYVGGLPVGVTEVEITQFFNHLMTITNATTRPGLSILSCYMNPEKRFAFVELRSVEETSNAMAFDGVMFKGEMLKIRRPHDYNPQAAELLGPANPSPDLNLAVLGLVNTIVEDGPNKLFIGGLPTYLGEEQVRSLLQMFGKLKAFNLITDRETGMSRGYGFCEYDTTKRTDIAIEGLCSISVGGKTLTVRRTHASHQTMDEKNSELLGNGNNNNGNAGIKELRIVRLEGVMGHEDLVDQERLEDVVGDIAHEVVKYGSVREIVVPRADQEKSEERDNAVLLELVDEASAQQMVTALNGRLFNDKPVTASLCDGVEIGDLQVQ